MDWVLRPDEWTLSGQIATTSIAMFGATLVYAPKRVFFGEVSLKDRLLMMAAGLAALACALNWPADGGA